MGPSLSPRGEGRKAPRVPSPHRREGQGEGNSAPLMWSFLPVLLQQAINGVVLGSLYVLVALGLTLIYGVLLQINFAHADIVTLGAFSAYFFTHSLGGGYLPSILVACLVGGVLGW